MGPCDTFPFYLGSANTEKRGIHKTTKFTENKDCITSMRY